ncbi:ABC transporter permease [Chakrabartyella piscis]|uniref:ABC transporter permease n=1 Tax=Chakrabartyella piscis TaxID=2918914 RepID=UPI0029587C2E|nr:ABC transporter permease [Chakrabartyella piscis]
MSDKRNIMFEIARGLIAITIAIAVAFLLIFASSDDPASALQCLLIRPVWTSGALNTKSILTILGRTTPMIFTGLAVCVMFSANQFNLGGEGAVMAGGFVAALVGIYVPMSAGLHVVASVLIGTITGGLIMIIPAVLKVKLKASEMVSSLMLNYVVMYIVLHFLNMNFADRSKGATQTFPMESTSLIGKMVTGTELTWGFPVAIIATILVAIFMYRTRWGYTIRMIGINESFSKYSGMKVGAVLVISQVIGGALSGMGGAIEVLGRYETFRWQGLPGYGWTGLTVAILAKNNPILVPFAALFIAYLDRGCELMSIYAGVPAEMIDIIQAVIFLFFAAEQFMAKTKHKMVVKGAKEEMKQIELAKEGGDL